MAAAITNPPDDDEPSADDLAAIERESGLISAELALLDAEIRILSAERDSSSLDWLRLLRAMHEVVRETAELYGERPTDSPADQRDAGESGDIAA
jgi:hypothetical protein